MSSKKHNNRNSLNGGNRVDLDEQRRLREQCENSGLDVGKGLEWRNWEPGRSYPKTLVVRNISKKTLKFQYKLPSAKYFMLPFPEAQVLCAGMTKSIEVVFRPVKKEAYKDVVVFVTTDGTIELPIRAVLKEIRIDIPEEPLDFGYQPVNETASLQFEVDNTGELPVDFEWQSIEPFQVEPATGSIPMGHSLSFTCNFSPKTAAVQKARLEFRVKNAKSQYYISVMGTAKYPFLTASTEMISFGRVTVGKVVEKVVHVHNKLVVHSSFSLRRVDKSSLDKSIIVSPKKGRVEANSSLPIRIRYSPITPGYSTAETIELKTPGGNSLSILCSGEAVGSSVQLSTSTLNFGQIPLGESTRRIIYVHNTGSIPTVYHFHSQKDGVFSFNKPSGKIRPQASVSVSVKFTPKNPLSYYRRIHCLVLQSAPVELDLIGAGYTNDQRPPPIFQRHVERQRKRDKVQISKIPPEMIEKELDKIDDPDLEGDYVDDASTLLGPPSPELSYIPASVTPSQTVVEDDEDSALHALAGFLDYISWDSLEKEERPVDIEPRYIDMGSASMREPSSPHDITVFNHTKGKITCEWVVPANPGGTKHSDRSKVFRVVPPIADIQPESSMQFQVFFRPAADHQSYGCEIEAYLSYKTMRNFRLVNERTISVPWCIPVVVTGRSVLDADRFTPDIELKTKHIQFPSCHVGGSSFQTITMYNTGDTVATYGFTTSPPFSFMPAKGLIPAKSHVVIVVRFSPMDTMSHTASARVIFNDITSNAVEVHLSGRGDEPKLEILVKDNEIFNRPTCIGTCTLQNVGFRNNSRIPVAYRWIIPPKHRDIVKVDKPFGELGPKETVQLGWTFCPLGPKRYNIPVKCAIVSARSHDASAESKTKLSKTIEHGTALVGKHELVETFGRERQDLFDAALENPQLSVNVVGEGIPGSLFVSPNDLDLGSVLVLTQNEREVLVQNGTDGMIAFEAVVEGLEGKDLSVRVEPSKVVLPARGSVELKLHVMPRFRKKYDEKIHIYLIEGVTSGTTINPADSLSKSSQRSELPVQTISLRCSADYPRVYIRDVRSVGHGTDSLWSRLSIAKINALLFEDLNKYERIFIDDSATLPKHDRSRELENLKDHLHEFVLDMVGGELNSNDDVVQIELYNSGPLQSDYSIQFPQEMESHLEHWADLGLPTPDQIKNEFVEENRIFAVNPPNGVIPSGGTAVISLRYAHSFVGSHSIEVLFGIGKGHHILWNLTGRTHERDMPRLEPRVSPEVELKSLAPVHLGDPNPPLQRLELRNVGTVILDYILDLTPTTLLSKENYNTVTLSCKESEGHLEPGESSFVPWVFAPIECKKYSVDVPVLVKEGYEVSENTLLRVSGDGIMPPETPSTDTEQSTEYEEKPLVEQIVEPPRTQSLLLENQIAKLSIERLDFGLLPLHVKSSRIVVVKNLSNVHPIEFRWDTVPHACDGLLSIYPRSGQLAPNGLRVCRVTLDPSSSPSLLRFDAVCRIVSLTARKKTAKITARRRAEEERAAQEETYATHGRIGPPTPPKGKKTKAFLSVTDSNIVRARTDATESTRPGSALADLVTADYGTTIPDFGLSTTVRSLVDSDAGFPLFLHVSADILDSEGFAARGGKMSSFYLPLVSKAVPVTEEQTGSNSLKLSDISHSQKAIEHVLSELCRDLAFDESVGAVLDALPDAPVPIYHQIREKEDEKEEEKHEEVEEMDDEEAEIKPFWQEIQSDSHFVSLAEEALESTLLNLVSEAVHREFDPTQLPMRIQSPKGRSQKKEKH